VFLLSTCLFCSSGSDFFLARHSSLGFAACVPSKAATWLRLLLACVSCCLVLCFAPECAVPAQRLSPAQTLCLSFCCSRCFVPSRIFVCGTLRFHSPATAVATPCLVFLKIFRAKGLCSRFKVSNFASAQMRSSCSWPQFGCPRRSLVSAICGLCFCSVTLCLVRILRVLCVCGLLQVEPVLFLSR
jgi:hypothetical protein